MDKGRSGGRKEQGTTRSIGNQREFGVCLGKLTPGSVTTRRVGCGGRREGGSRGRGL